MKKTFFTLADNIIGIINDLLYIVVGLAVVGFMWGIVKILFNPENEIAKKEGRSFMLYGILTLFVMTSIWGLVNILNGSIATDTTDPTDDSKTYNSPKTPDSLKSKEPLPKVKFAEPD